MVNLHKLDLSYNCIKGIPDTIVDLKNLCYLNLSNNFLKELPDALCNLPNLELLDVDENLLKYMPNLPSNLIYFSAAGNGLFDVPQNFDELIHLEQVYLTNNKLVSLPSLHALKKLTVLNLCNNSLFELPVLAPALNELDVSNNQLKALPSCIGDLSDLEIIFLDTPCTIIWSLSWIIKTRLYLPTIDTHLRLDIFHTRFLAFFAVQWFSPLEIKIWFTIAAVAPSISHIKHT
jgi:Leucine-rich repeat (LRR) protein